MRVLLLEDKYEITADPMNYIVKVKIYSKKGSDFLGYGNSKYFGKLEQALIYILNLELKISRVSSIESLRDLILSTEERIKSEVKSLNI